MRILTLLAVALTVTGCLALETKKEDFYTLDTRYLELCRGSSNNCVELALVAPGIVFADPIEEAYAAQITAPNYPLSLAKMMLKPADASYSAKAADDSGRFYLLPVNDKTNVAWDTLNSIHDWIYPDEND
ncbi:hypothetical protein [Marinobacterium rhizophilum]|uniref:Lipoprotein n=1 Tax=Marinobacterium rhizophilum TaxID=420402 RepID=A0ABY5HH64_9GAMM|nr:hypothetical protein [Marinobacterium rhizophilum]UTW10311.1 hypothetical protein KDW95_13475 [Marinobacterium rhizophilum]